MVAAIEFLDDFYTITYIGNVVWNITSLYNNIKLFRVFMYIMSFVLALGKLSSHFADTTKSPGNSYDDKGNGS